MLNRRHLLTAAGAALAAPAFARGAAAQGAAGGAATRWQMATPYPDGNFHTRNIRSFVEEIQTVSGGRLQVQLHSNASLLPMPQIKNGVQRGQVQMGEILLAAYSNEDVFFDADSIPQLVSNLAEARRLSDLQRPFIEARLARQGLSLLPTEIVHGRHLETRLFQATGHVGSHAADSDESDSFRHGEGI